MDFTSVVVFVLGCLAGTVTGIIPGIGPPHMLAIVYIYLVGMDPLHLVVFYIGYLTVCNFVDTIPSLYFGIPGEVSSVPASKESAYLNQQGLTDTAMRLAAIGRLLGSVLALTASFFIVSWLLSNPQIFSSRWQIVFYAFTLGCILLAGDNRWWTNGALMIAGFGLSAVGYNYYLETNVLTFGLADLHGGLPLMPVLIGIYVLPQLLQQDHTKINHVNESSVAHSGNYVPSMLRGTVLGYVLGLVPGMSYMLGSTAAYTLERWWHRRWPAQRDHSVAAVVASETASNAGTSSVLIPLLLFGIPIIASEAILYELMLDSGAVFNLGGFLLKHYPTLAAWFVVACVVGLILSWPLARHCRSLAEKLLHPKFRWILIAIILISLTVDAVDNQRFVLYALTFLTSFAAGWWLKKQDVMPLVFVFVLGSSMQSVIYNLVQLYF